jgi:hypothetical protein
MFFQEPVDFQEKKNFQSKFEKNFFANFFQFFKILVGLGKIFISSKYLLGWVLIRKNWIVQNKTFSTLSCDRKENAYFNTVFGIFLGPEITRNIFEAA